MDAIKSQSAPRRRRSTLTRRTRKGPDTVTDNHRQLSTPKPHRPSSTYTTSLAALQDKVDAIAQDSCTTRPAVQAYPDCARYVAEVGNAALATQGAAASVNGAGSLQATATRLADEVGLFSRTGCVAAPGVSGPPAQICGDALRKIQVDLAAMRTQLAEATPAP